jgi:integrase
VEHLTKDELLALLKAAREHSERDWLLVLVSFSHGLRASEAVGLTKANFRDGHVSVKRLKGSLKTVQPLLSNADPLLDEKAALERYLSTLAANDRLFPISRFAVDRIMKRHGATAGIPAHKRHAHVLKHTTAMLAIRQAGIENVRVYLG